MAAKHRIFCTVALAVFAVDRVTKTWTQFTLEVGERFDVIPGFFYVTHVRNPGAAFGLFENAQSEIKAIVFATAAALALIVVVIHLRSLAPGDRRESTALALVAGGALGNLLDRLPYFGTAEVIDFLHFDWWRGYPWPDFNIADVAIMMGVGGLMVEMIARESTSHADHVKELDEPSDSSHPE
jgi:signal peptidase II